MTEQQFCLKWNNFHSNMSEIFHNMLQSESMVDVTIACEGASLKAHKMILAACSPFLQSLLMANPCKHPVIILKDVRFVDLKATIDFMYKGEVNVAQSQLGSVLKAAETLKIKGLTDVMQRQRESIGKEFVQIHPPKKRKKNRKHKNVDSSPAQSGDESCTEIDASMTPGLNENRGSAAGNNNKTTTMIEKVKSGEGGELSELQTGQPQEMAIGTVPNQPLMTTTEVAAIENGQEDVIIATDHASLIEHHHALRQIATYDDSSQHQGLPVVTVTGANELSQLSMEAEDTFISKKRRPILRRTSAYARALRYPEETFYESSNTLYCKACGEVVNHMKASVIKYHIKSQKHQLNKRRMCTT